MLFSKKETLIPYSNVTKVDLRKPFVGRLLNYGDIEVVSSSATKIVIKGIRNPERVYQEISKRLEKLGKVKEE
jgi:membrane protein YdbS with pleckstrin-like domain